MFKNLRDDEYKFCANKILTSYELYEIDGSITDLSVIVKLSDEIVVQMNDKLSY